jgi:uncharacterized protein (TIGR03437 family)
MSILQPCHLLLCLACASAQPAVTSVFNSASYGRYGMPNWGIAQGSLITIFGSGLGPAQLVQSSGFPLDTSLAGTSVQISQSNATISAYILYTSATQIAAVLPSRAPVGTANLSVIYQDAASSPQLITVVKGTFGIFTLNQQGTGPAVARNFNSTEDQPINTLIESAHPGQVVILLGTGLGPISGDESKGAVIGDLAQSTDVKVYVGNQTALITYAGRSSYPGVDQINFVVPTGAAGCYVPIAVDLPKILRVIDGTHDQADVLSNIATISITSDGKVCSDPTGLSGADLTLLQQQGALRLGAFSLIHTYGWDDVGDLGSRVTPVGSDRGWASFGAADAQALLRAQGIFGMPAFGTCVSFPIGLDRDPFPLPAIGKVLDAGPVLTIHGPGGTRPVVRQTDGGYASVLDTGNGYLRPGDYTIDNGSGGFDVGAFQANLSIPVPFIWTNKAIVGIKTRLTPYRVTWTGGDPNGYAVIAGFGLNQAVGWYFLCTEHVEAGSFTTGAVEILSRALFHDQAVEGGGHGPGFGPLQDILMLGEASSTNRFLAPGLDLGYVNSLVFDATPDI